MTDQRHAPDSHVADYHAPEPSIPATHDSFEPTEDTVIIYGQDPQKWIWSDGAVRRTDYR